MGIGNDNKSARNPTVGYLSEAQAQIHTMNAALLSVIALVAALFCGLFLKGPNQGFYPRKWEIRPYGSRLAVESQLVVTKYIDNLPGPESMTLDPSSGILYVGLQNGTIMKVWNGKSEVFVHTGGRPLGSAVDPSGKGLYACVPPLGILYILFEDQSMQLVSTISEDNIPLRFVDDLTVAKDGMVYFTDASRISPVLNKADYYDVLFASLLDVTEGSGTGRLLRYDPHTGITKTLLDNLYFPNGIALSSDESFLVVAETYNFHLRRYYLEGDYRGGSEIFASGLPGMPDGVSTAESGGFDVAIVSEVCLRMIAIPVRSLMSNILLNSHIHR